jgi:hypothetical protein
VTSPAPVSGARSVRRAGETTRARRARSASGSRAITSCPSAPGRPGPWPRSLLMCASPGVSVHDVLAITLKEGGRRGMEEGKLGRPRHFTSRR